MKNVNGIQTPFDDAIYTPPDVAGQSVASRGGMSIEDGKSQTGGGETGQHVTTVSVRDDHTDPTAAAKDIRGSNYTSKLPGGK